MSAKTFEDLFLDELKDMYDAEKRLVKALPKWIKSSASKELVTVLQDHLGQTEAHVARLDGAFRQLGRSPERRPCVAMKGLLAEGDDLSSESHDPLINDAAIIAAAQKVAHYEIATYGTMREWARQLGRSEIANLLQQSLDDDSAVDRRLSRLATTLNTEAAAAR